MRLLVTSTEIEEKRVDQVTHQIPGRFRCKKRKKNRYTETKVQQNVGRKAFKTNGYLQSSGAEPSKGDPFSRTVLEENSHLFSKHLKFLIRHFDRKLDESVELSLLRDRRVDHTRCGQRTVRDCGLLPRK